MQAQPPQRKKYIAYDAMTNELEYFKTPEEAKEWILDQDWSEGIPQELTDGAYFIAEITHVSAVLILHNKANYPLPNGEEWPYGNRDDWIGEPYMVSVAETTTNKNDN